MDVAREWTAEEQREHRVALVAGLRSGDYPQTQYRLRGDDGYCCLGLACEISGLGTWQPRAGMCALYEIKGATPADAFLPLPVQQYFGFASRSGNYGGLSLTTLNDSGTPFPEIAAIIESEPTGLIAEPGK